MAKKIGYKEALNKMLCGESIPAKNLSDGVLTFLRFQARTHGKELVDSGIFDYRHYYFA